jgi:radial spoke head protein 4A
LSVKKLVQEKKLRSVRLWGKVLGLKQDYIVVEAESAESNAQQEDDEEMEEEEEEGATEERGGEEFATQGKKKQKKLPEHEQTLKEMLSELDDPTLPKIKYKAPVPLPKELGVGVNKYQYYVCHYGTYINWLLSPSLN